MRVPGFSPGPAYLDTRHRGPCPLGVGARSRSFVGSGHELVKSLEFCLDRAFDLRTFLEGVLFTNASYGGLQCRFRPVWAQRREPAVGVCLDPDAVTPEERLNVFRGEFDFIIAPTVENGPVVFPAVLAQVADQLGVVVWG